MGPLYVPEGKFQEAYTPGAGRITSAKLGNKELAYAKFMISEDANVSWQDMEGSTAILTFPLKGGIPYPFLVSKITAVSAGTVIIFHDGILNK
jgi:hypothetical protein